MFDFYQLEKTMSKSNILLQKLDHITSSQDNQDIIFLKLEFLVC